MELEVIIQLAKTALAVLESNPELSKTLFKEIGKYVSVDGAAVAEQITSLTKQLGTAKETISNLTKQLGDVPLLNNELKSAKNKILSLNKQITNLTEQLDEYKNADVDKLKDENKRLKKNIEALKKAKNKPARERKEFTNEEKNQIIRKLHDKGYYIDTYNYNDTIEDLIDEITDEERKEIFETAAEVQKENEEIKEKFYNNPEQFFIPGGNKGVKEKFV